MPDRLAALQEQTAAAKSKKPPVTKNRLPAH
jgi:hypothetical protein